MVDPPRLFFGNDRTRLVRKATDLIDYLPPEKRYHYRDGCSMAEAAKCWVAAGGRLPLGLAALVGDDVLEAAHFEYRVCVWGGGASMTDVMAFTPDAVIAVEAKARETFGEVVSVWIKRRSSNRNRIVGLYAQALGVSEDALLGIRYQLLHRTLAAALVANHCQARNALMVVQSFAPANCDEHARNRSDFDRYVATVGSAPVLCGIGVRLGWIDEITA